MLLERKGTGRRIVRYRSTLALQRSSAGGAQAGGW
jgi:hypothetical protein